MSWLIHRDQPAEKVVVLFPEYGRIGMMGLKQQDANKAIEYVKSGAVPTAHATATQVRWLDRASSRVRLCLEIGSR